MSLWSDLSVPSTPESRKRSMDCPDASSSSPKIRRTTDDPQRTRPPTLPVSRAATFPTTKSKGMYPSLVEESDSRMIPANSLSPQIGNPSTSFASTSKETPSHSAPSSFPSIQFPETLDPVVVAQDSSDSSTSSEIAKNFSFIDVKGDDSRYSLIAHDLRTQRLMDAKHISRGAQFEIARGVSQGNWQWTDVTEEKIGLLQGSNADSAWKVAHVMRSRNLSSAPKGNMELW